LSEVILEERTKDYARRIIRLCAALPRGPAARVLGDQLLRSGTSIGASYREAMRSRSKAEFVAKLGDSLEEASESEY
jgi:four helix bundle protein